MILQSSIFHIRPPSGMEKRPGSAAFEIPHQQKPLPGIHWKSGEASLRLVGDKELVFLIF